MRYLAPLILPIAVLAACGDADTRDEARDSSATQASPTAATPSVKPNSTDELSGFGATREAWNATHEMADEPGLMEGVAYGPIVRGDTYAYTGVSGEERVNLYVRTFPEDTDLKTAEQIVLADFPDDAKITRRDNDQERCQIALIKSATLKDKTGENAVAAFGTVPDSPDAPDVLDRQDVTDASVLPHYSGSGDLGDC